MPPLEKEEKEEKEEYEIAWLKAERELAILEYEMAKIYPLVTPEVNKEELAQ